MWLSSLIIGLLISPAVASSTDGTIDSTNRYVWSETAGWIDFGTTEGNVHVTDSTLTGYAWSENVGWISLNCSNTDSCATVDYRVTNDGEGTLGGYGWSENVGWIQFAPTNGGVTISSSGVFSGYAWGELVGWIVFNCANTDSCATVDYKVSTDWRPASSRTTTSTNAEDVSQPSGGSRGGTDSAIMQHRIAQAHALVLSRYDQQLQTDTDQDNPEDEPLDEPDVFASDKERELYRSAQKVQQAKQQAAAREAVFRIADQGGLLFAYVDDSPVLYRDVPTQSWYAPYVAALIEQEIAQGYADDTGKPLGEFGVSNPVTYAEVLKMALEAAGTILPDGRPQNESAQGTWAAAYVLRAEIDGLPVITPDLNVHDAATRGEVIALILAVMDVPSEGNLDLVKEPYSDLPSHHPQVQALIAATYYGLIGGDTALDGTPLNTVRPDDIINRAEVAKIVALLRASR